MSDSSRPHGLQPTRLLHPWDFPGKSTGVGCHCLLCTYVLTSPYFCSGSVWFDLMLAIPAVVVRSSQAGSLSWGEDWLYLDTCHCSRASSRDQECLLFAHLLYVFLIPSLHWIPHYLTFQIHIWAASRLLSYNSHTFLCAVRVITWRRKWQTTPVFLPGEFHGQRNLAGYSQWGCKELDMTEWLTHTHTHTHRIITRVSLPSKSPRKIRCCTTLLSKYFTLKCY